MHTTSELTSSTPSRQIWVFLAVLILLSTVADLISIHLVHANPMSDRFVMWVPAFATFITCGLCGVDVKSLGWQWPGARWLALAYLVPLLYTLPVYVVTWLILRGSFDVSTFMRGVAGSYNLDGAPVFGTLVVGMPLLLTVGMIGSVTWALGEEIGWRGFLLPRIESRIGYTNASLVVGLIWAVWHYPGLLFGKYNAGTNPVYAVACFTLMVVAMSFVIGWLRLRTRSIWPCAMLHASHNTFVQGIFDPLTAETGLSRYVTTEFGAGMAIVIAVTGYFFWTRRGRLTFQERSV